MITQVKDNRIVNALFWAVALAVVAVAAGSFTLSFNALLDLATQQGQPARLAWIWPVIVDLSLVIYTAALLVAQLQRRPARLPVALVIGYGGVTIAGNILHAPAGPVAWFVAALPPVSLILGTEVLRTMARHQIERRATVANLDNLGEAQTVAVANLDKLTRQIEAARLRLAELQQDKARPMGANPQDMTAAKQDKIAARRADVLGMLQAGQDKATIAEALGVSPRTVKRDVKALNGKAEALGVTL